MASQRRFADLMQILRGAEMVTRALASHQCRAMNRAWNWSTLKSTADAVSSKAKKSIADIVSAPEIAQADLAKQGKEVMARIGVVTEGVKQFAKFSYSTYITNEDREFVSRHDGPGSSYVETLVGETIDENLSSDAKPSDGSQLNNKKHNGGIVNASKDRPDAIGQTRSFGTSAAEGPQPSQFICETASTRTKPSSSSDAPRSKSTESSKANGHTKDPKSAQVNFEQKLSDRSQERKVPASRMGRLMSYGGLAAGLGVGALTEVTKRTLGLSEKDSNPFLNEANAERIVDTLCKVRGAALKLGQMLSLQDGTIINPQLQRIFERVRQSADFMPMWQTESVLVDQLGEDWRSKVATFEFRPLAAASIGQVHHATLKDRTEVAVKIQYPGVAMGMESDIKNLMTTLKMWNILPEGLFIDNIVQVARKELANEVNYIREAQNAKKFRELMERYPEYHVPKVIDELSRRQVFTTELVHGSPLDKCVDLDQETRNKIATMILRLCMLELFEFRFMQTDPNWSNFFYNPENKRISLLDFGACREFSPHFVDNYMRTNIAAALGDRRKVLLYSRELKFLTGYEAKIMEDAHVDSVMILGEAFASNAMYDFGNQDMTTRINHIIPTLLQHRLTPPPEESYTLHRKLAGAFLLASKLRAQINCRTLFEETRATYKFTTEDSVC